MNRILKPIAVAAVALSLAAFGFSQAAGPKGGAQGGVKGGLQGGPDKERGERMHKMRQEMMAKLDLSPAQKKQIDAIDAKFRGEMKKLREAPGDPQTKRPKMRELMQSHQKAVASVLTPAQRKKFEDMMAEFRKKRQEQGGREGHGAKKPGAGGTNPPPKG